AINSLQNREFLENLTANQSVIVFDKIIAVTDDMQIISQYLEILFKNEKYAHIIKYIEDIQEKKRAKQFYKLYVFSLISLGEYQKAINIMGELKTFDDDFIPYLSMIIKNISLLEFYHLLEYFLFPSCESKFLELLSELDKGNFDEEKITDIQLITTIHNTIAININAFDPYNIKDDLKELQKIDPEQLKYLLMKELFHSLVIDIPTHVVSQNNSEKDKMHVAEPQNDYISTMDKMNKTMKLKQDISTEEDIKRARHHESSLHIIRLAIENTIIFHQGEKILKKEKEKRKAEEQAREKLQQMIQQFSHTMANTLFPNSIFEVVNRLKKHVEFNKDARVLFDAYQAELLMSNQGQLLRAKNGGSGAEFQSFIRQDRRDQDTLGTIGIESIVQRSAERLIGRFLNSSYHKIDTVRNEICSLSNKNINELRQNYEQNVFFEERENIIDWINKYIGLFEVTIDDTWQSIQMLENGYSDAMLQGHLGEILFNALKYSDWTKNKWCRLSFISDENYLFIQCSNSQRKNPETSHSGKRLLGIANDLNILSNNRKTLEKTIEKDKFTVNLIYQKDLFIKRKLKLEAWGD
ncbi:hypothetical protein KAJ27_04480, partial [bacterium]|nr:hypothetical protein [bacterium]